MTKNKFETEVLRLLRSIHSNSVYTTRILASDPDNQVEHILISGQRLAQFHRVCELIKENPGMSRYEAANRAFDEIPGGFPTRKQLYKYCLRHPIECNPRR